VTIVDMNNAAMLEKRHLRYRHAISPYLGLPLHGLVRHTLVRGGFVVRDGEPAATIMPQFVRPDMK
jgi:dihydroorotase-like cyclic amidohydrolase